ncbi:hypothetical protein ANN_20218 [Periplaneta americana]|uniref:Mos1 transposase HTH domain-containing protein n=1 Tax=Periplaneta americana TaxID=6978 RepID=A0ABQ8SC31_PERAM|nr:hypothetical protein ANN_20218 [Periplaneta americana]
MEYHVEKVEHFRHIFIFEFNRGSKAAAAARNICAVYGDNASGEIPTNERVVYTLFMSMAVRRGMRLMAVRTSVHFCPTVRQYLNNTFPGRWIGRRGPVVWPAQSPDLNPLDTIYNAVRVQAETSEVCLRCYLISLSRSVHQRSYEHHPPAGSSIWRFGAVTCSSSIDLFTLAYSRQASLLSEAPPGRRRSHRENGEKNRVKNDNRLTEQNLSNLKMSELTERQRTSRKRRKLTNAADYETDAASSGGKTSTRIRNR